jgi:hypothetical protein
MKLGDNKRSEVTEPDFLGKIPFGPNWAKSVQNVAKIRFFKNVSKSD